MPDPTDFITVVSGVPRSGTSLMMQLLAAGGLPPLTDEIREADPSNPRGYFEFEPVKRLRSDQTWLGDAPGRAVKIIHLLLRELPTDGRFQYRVLLMKRPLEEVVWSQKAMLERQGKTGAEPAKLIPVYQNQLHEIEDWLTTQRCFRWMPVEYQRVLIDPVETAKKVQAFLNRPLDLEAMAAAVSPGLCHHRIPDQAV